MPGILALMGGDEFRPDCIPMDRALLARVGTALARVVIVPTAAAHQNPHQATSNGIRYFESLGAAAAAAMILTRSDADDPARFITLGEADVIYLTGGDPRYLLDTLAASAAWDAIRRRWAAGASLIGSSAGAMVLGGLMAYGGPPVAALGAAPGVLVIPHFSVAPGQPPRPVPRAELPAGVSVLDIPTASSTVTTDGLEWEVIGRAPVAVYPPDPASAFVVPPREHFSTPAPSSGVPSPR